MIKKAKAVKRAKYYFKIVFGESDDMTSAEPIFMNLKFNEANLFHEWRIL